MTEKELCSGKTFKEVMKEVEFHISDKQRIAKLEKDNEELKAEIENLKKTYRKQRNKRIDELQKENAKLKAENENLKNYHRNDN